MSFYPYLNTIFANKGLSGAALFGAFFLLLRKRHTRTYSQINYKALEVSVREILMGRKLVGDILSKQME
jgi:hypothetical protein